MMVFRGEGNSEQHWTPLVLAAEQCTHGPRPRPDKGDDAFH